MQDLIVLGGGEHARVVIEAARSVPENWRGRGFVGSCPCKETQTRMRLPQLGADDCLASYPNAALVLGLGVSFQVPDAAGLMRQAQTTEARGNLSEASLSMTTHWRYHPRLLIVSSLTV